MLDKVDEMIIGGGMAFTFRKVMDNMPVSTYIIGVYILAILTPNSYIRILIKILKGIINGQVFFMLDISSTK